MIPGFQQRESRTVADLADNEAIGSQSQWAFQQPRHIYGVAGMKADCVFLAAQLDSAVSLQDHHASIG